MTADAQSQTLPPVKPVCACGEALKDCKTSTRRDAFVLVRTADIHLSQTENILTSRFINDQAKRADLTIGSSALPYNDRSYSSHCFPAREPPLPEPHRAGQQIDTRHHSKPTSNSGDNRQARPAGEHRETVSQCRPAQHALVSAHRSHS